MPTFIRSLLALFLMSSVLVVAGATDARAAQNDCYTERHKYVESEFLGTNEVGIRFRWWCSLNVEQGVVVGRLRRVTTNQVEDTQSDICGNCRNGFIVLEKSGAVMGSTYRYFIGMRLKAQFGYRWQTTRLPCIGAGTQIMDCVWRGELKSFAPPQSPGMAEIEIQQIAAPVCVLDEVCADTDPNDGDTQQTKAGNDSNLLAPADPALAPVDNAQPQGLVSSDPEDGRSPDLMPVWLWCEGFIDTVFWEIFGDFPPAHPDCEVFYDPDPPYPPL